MNTTSLAKAALISTCLLSAGCGSDEAEEPAQSTQTFSCDAETRDDEYSAGMAKTADSLGVMLVSSDPAPPVRDDNLWIVRVTDNDGGAMVGATLDVYAEMPDDGHPTTRQAAITELGGGEYELNPVNLFMPGFWTVTIGVTPMGGTRETVMFAFCVE